MLRVWCHAEAGQDEQLDAALTQKGRWDYVIGLVGKPSAGKVFSSCIVLCPHASGTGHAKLSSMHELDGHFDLQRVLALLPPASSASVHLSGGIDGLAGYARHHLKSTHCFVPCSPHCTTH